jgi:hypothetical protein
MTGATDGFARFWRHAILEEAASVPPALEVSVTPAIAALGTAVRVTARVRATDLPAGDDRIDIGAVTARAVSPGARVDAFVRLWPTSEPGVYEGSWSPSSAGDYDIAVTTGSLRGDAALMAMTTVAAESAADPDGLALLARTSGGRVFRLDQSSALVDAMRNAYPSRRLIRPSHPMRSPWWVVPFAALLCAEWSFRRRHGNP